MAFYGTRLSLVFCKNPANPKGKCSYLRADLYGLSLVISVQAYLTAARTLNSAYPSSILSKITAPACDLADSVLSLSIALTGESYSLRKKFNTFLLVISI